MGQCRQVKPGSGHSLNNGKRTRHSTSIVAHIAPSIHLLGLFQLSSALQPSAPALIHNRFVGITQNNIALSQGTAHRFHPCNGGNSIMLDTSHIENAVPPVPHSRKSMVAPRRTKLPRVQIRTALKATMIRRGKATKRTCPSSTFAATDMSQNARNIAYPRRKVARMRVWWTNRRPMI